MKQFLGVFAFCFAALTGLQPLAQAASSPCNGPNGGAPQMVTGILDPIDSNP
jgi:hypothetical protein